MEDNIKYISCMTLVDISLTGIARIPSKNPSDLLRKQRNQQRNWETLIQTIGISAQPIYLEDPLRSEIKKSSDWVFGEYYSAPAKIWIFVFGIEHPDVFQNHQNELGKLITDLDSVPIIINLDESVEFVQPIFCTLGPYKNTHFSPINPDFLHKV